MAIAMTMPTHSQHDPFAPRSLGARPSFASYWPDTRFIELRSHDGYFHHLLGRAPTDDDEHLLMLGGSVVHHERVHWQIAHSLTWGVMRSALVNLRTTLASLFFRQMSPSALSEELVRHQNGIASLRRTENFDLVIPDHWSATSHSIAEHAWLLTMLPEIIDYGGIAPVRPPDFMLGIAAQYLGREFDPVDILFGDDHAGFHNRVRSFRQEGSLEALQDTQANGFPAIVVEECLAVLAQLTFLDRVQTRSVAERNICTQFRADILGGVFGADGGLYAPCFRAAAQAASCQFEDLNLMALGVVCELALDPPLPFAADGSAASWTWSNLHPGSRFAKLLKISVDRGILTDVQTLADPGERLVVEEDLLVSAQMERAEHSHVQQWLATYDEDTTEWPSQELGWQHARTAHTGRSEIAKCPGVLQDMLGSCDLPEAHTFYDLPFVILDGVTQLDDPESESEALRSGQQILNAHVARMTDHLAFHTGPIHPRGLPTDPEDGFSVFTERAHEFFKSAWGVDVPKMEIIRNERGWNAD
ncbi:hypothetical protein [Marinibacterium sp. SX1]|uniref:hypothetical protein n=1 Tax=Marinibacterium sp. SX1 TaxID=3388424 RepID=UPI003D16296D